MRRGDAVFRWTIQACLIVALWSGSAHAVEMTRVHPNADQEQQEEAETESIAQPIGIGGPGSAATGNRIGEHIPNGDRIGVPAPRYSPNPPYSDDDDGRDRGDDDELDIFQRGKNGLVGFGEVTTSIVTLAAGLSALTAENGSFFGKMFGFAKTFSGTVGLLYGGDNLLSAFTGKYFLPDSFRTWGRVAAFVNHGVAMMEVTKLAFGKLGNVWDKVTGKSKKPKETARAVDDLYRFNCARGGQCFLPPASNAPAPVLGGTPEDAYRAACRARYSNGVAPAWWDQAVCRNAGAVAGLDANTAARMGDQDATRALQKGDAYWSACRTQAPDADLDGSFYASACGDKWTVDPASGATVPLWLAADTWQQARQWGVQNGASAR